MQLEQFCGHTVHTDFLTSDSVVVDLGANGGEFARQIITRFGCRCLSVEANPVLYAAGRRTSRMQWFNFAVGDSEGRLPFHVRQNSESSSLFPSGDGDVVSVVDVPVRPLDVFLKENGVTDVALLKCDIEGAEVDMLNSCSDAVLRHIAQISIEFHDFNHMVSLRDVRWLIERLQSLGFLTLRMSAHGHCDTLFINRARCEISLPEYFWLRYAVRNWRGVRRMVGGRPAH